MFSDFKFGTFFKSNLKKYFIIFKKIFHHSSSANKVKASWIVANTVIFECRGALDTDTQGKLSL